MSRWPPWEWLSDDDVAYIKSQKKSSGAPKKEKGGGTKLTPMKFKIFDDELMIQVAKSLRAAK